MRTLAPLVALAVSACGEEPVVPPPVSICFEPPADRPTPPAGCAPGAPTTSYPIVDSACTVGVDEPHHLVTTTTDFSTGAVTVATTDEPDVIPDVALGSTDAIPFYDRGLLYVVHRYQLDFVDVLDPCAGFRSLGQFPIDVPGATSTNPYSIAFRTDGLAFVPLFGVPRIAVLDFSRPSTEAVVDWIDTSRFADDDGNPESALAVGCGDTLFVSARRLDPAFAPVDREVIFAVDATTCQPYQLTIDLHGYYVKKARLDPTDPTGRTLLVLTTGIERIDLVSGTSEWALADTELVAAGIDGLQLQAFDLDATSHTAYLAAYDREFTAVEIWRGRLDGPAELERVATGLNSVEGTLEIVGERLWFGDTTPGQSGLRVWDLAADPPAQTLGPFATGLPPYALIAVP